ncbi:Gfo/Idh/MocA family oxidoreductase [Burkholderia multivorans]|uniref:Gfo/Idh/MocA family oxidoreductase n=1 Tax=Burkholderia multivorans TaxID=87883 RepID=UPI001C22ADE9|nr:Gfo/Idh/MocA family oxidoreductase [Burkholderia multivorans]MBU9651095.1 Gfo/Idh/MocA family oxidoreductase [Burkholderia multivorans]
MSTPARSRDIRIAIVGEGAMGRTHAQVLSALPDVTLTALVARDLAAGRALCAQFGIPALLSDVAECAARADVDALVVASPSGLHVAHACASLDAGKPCLVEIPVGLSLAQAQALAQRQRDTGAVVMAAHSRRFSPAHRLMKARIAERTFHLHHLVVETYFLRRSNLNMLGEPRSWTDNLLWHHACHSVDLAAWLLDGETFDVWGQRGPLHASLGIPMDMTIGLCGRSTGTLVTLALSFNNKGPFGGFYRYIGEEDTVRVHRDEALDGDGNAIPLVGAAFADQDRAFVEAVRSGQTPESDIHSVLPAMTLLARIEETMEAAR